MGEATIKFLYKTKSKSMGMGIANSVNSKRI